jgi:predicted O-methyltransferase YrrM
MNEFFRLKSFLKYQRDAKTKYYLHSPFVYGFFLDILNNTTNDSLGRIHTLRKQLATNNTAITIDDFGTGYSKSVRISHIEKHVAIKHKYGKVLYKLVEHFKPGNIIEIGTSVGLSSAYMALANTESRIHTLEGAPALLNVARHNHKQLGISNVNYIAGNFKDTLHPALNDLPVVDMVFFDGNHTSQATLSYFKACLEKANAQSVFVFDDIYWNRDMNKAWQSIQAHPSVTLTIDIYQLGICFFMKEKLAKENFVLRY